MYTERRIAWWQSSLIVGRTNTEMAVRISVLKEFMSVSEWILPTAIEMVPHTVAGKSQDLVVDPVISLPC